MMRCRHIVELKEGVKVELLFTPSMYAVARRRGLRIEVEDTSDSAAVMMAYTKLMYVAALNAHEVKLYDAPALGEFPYRLIDFVEWSAARQDEFMDTLDIALRCVLGKGLKELEGEKPEASKKK